MTSPFADLATDEWQALLARSSSGEHPIFSGEEASGPIIDTSRHTIHSGQFFEVEPEQLIDVAKHMAQDGETAQKTIEKAYTLICEAHLVSRNIRHWNEKTRRGHVSERIHNVVIQHEINEGKDKGKVPRLAVLMSFLESRGQSSTGARKLFSSWIKETIRKRSYSENIPWNPVREDFDEALNKKLLDKGWIRWFYIGNSGHLMLPEQTVKPRTKPRRKVKKGEHVTRPWWGTKTVWWPAATQEEIKNFKGEYLIDNSKHFRSEYSAKQALMKFDRWLDIMDALKRETENQAHKPKPKRDSDTGAFKQV